MIRFTRQATAQIAELRRHYAALDRPEAIRNLSEALRQASEAIERDPAVGLPAPRPYPDLAHPGRAWIKTGRYWIAYRIAPPPVALGVFFEAADIPSRLPV